MTLILKHKTTWKMSHRDYLNYPKHIDMQTSKVKNIEQPKKYNNIITTANKAVKHTHPYRQPLEEKQSTMLFCSVAINSVMGGFRSRGLITSNP